MRGAFLLLCLCAIVVRADYRLAGVASAAGSTSVRATDLWLDSANVSVRHAASFTAVRGSAPPDYASYTAYTARAAALDPAGVLYTLSLAPANDGWRVCRWPALVANNRSLAPPTCSRNLAPLAAGAPSAVAYLAGADVLLVAYPQAGDIYALVARTLAPLAGKWASGLAAPCSLAVDPVHERVYIALLNGNAVVRRDYSGGQVDAGAAWLVVPRPRFVRANLEAAAADPANQPAFYVLSLDADAPELHRVDRDGASMGSVANIAGDWLMDDTTGARVLSDERADEADPGAQFVTSVAVDARGVLYVARTRSTRLDTYSTLSGEQLAQADDYAAQSDTLVKGTPVLITDAARSEPLALLDSYALRVRGSERAVLMGCVANFASGATYGPPDGVWLCPRSNAVLLYDQESVYTLEVDTERQTACFGEYLLHVDTDSIADVYLDGERDELYALLSSGEVLAVERACAPGNHTLRRNVSAAFNVAALAGLAHDFFVAPSTGPALVSSRELLLANGSWFQQPETTCGAPGGELGAFYSAALDGIVRAFATAEALAASFVPLENATDVECVEHAAPEPGDRYAFVQDALSGVFGWLDVATGALHMQGTQSGVALVYAGETPPLASDALWALSDPDARSVRYPQPETTTRPPGTPSGAPRRTGYPVAYIVLWIALGVLLTCCLVCAIGVLRSRRTRSAAFDAESSGAKSAMPGAESKTYASSSSYDHNGDDANRTYACSPKTRYYLRLILCPFGFCYDANDRLRVGAGVLGGRRKARPYVRMDDELLSGRELPRLSPADEEQAGGAAEPSLPPVSDVGAGGSAFVDVNLAPTQEGAGEDAERRT